MAKFSATGGYRPLEGVFVKRLNRFLVECEVEGHKQKAFLPNPGRLWEYLFPGAVLLLNPCTLSPTRKTRLTVSGILKDGTWVMLDTHTSNKAVSWLVSHQLIPGLEDSRVIREEVSFGNSRFDLLLQDTEGPLFLEVKSCTLFGNSIAMFPDAPSERAARHVRELQENSRKGGRSGILFLVHSRKPSYFLPDYHTDPAFARALYDARHDIRILAASVAWERDLTIGEERTGILDIPWSVIEKEDRDSGSYLVILELAADQDIFIGSLGRVHFKSGFYVYVGSAARGLEQRLSRHMRKRKRFHWHIDHLRDHAQKVRVLPIRTSFPLECILADRMRIISEGSIIGFGSSDCGCPSHLFYMKEDPVRQRAFVQAVMDLRINRIEPLIQGSQFR